MIGIPVCYPFLIRDHGDDERWSKTGDGDQHSQYRLSRQRTPVASCGKRAFMDVTILS